MDRPRRLPHSPPPNEGESLTSWVGRIQRDYGVSEKRVGELLGLSRPSERAGLPLAERLMALPTPKAMRLSAATGLCPEQATRMVLGRCALTWFSRDDHDRTTFGRSWRVRRWVAREGALLCPDCVRESDGAYLLAWQLRISFACVKHRRFLCRVDAEDVATSGSPFAGLALFVPQDDTTELTDELLDLQAWLHSLVFNQEPLRHGRASRLVGQLLEALRIVLLLVPATSDDDLMSSFVAWRELRGIPQLSVSKTKAHDLDGAFAAVASTALIGEALRMAAVMVRGDEVESTRQRFVASVNAGAEPRIRWMRFFQFVDFEPRYVPSDGPLNHLYNLMVRTVGSWALEDILLDLHWQGARQ